VLALPGAVHAGSCKCQDPPGGKFTCEADQIAICEVKNNSCNGQCVDSQGRQGADLAQLVFSEALGKDVSELSLTKRDVFRRSLLAFSAQPTSLDLKGGKISVGLPTDIAHQLATWIDVEYKPQIEGPRDEAPPGIKDLDSPGAYEAADSGPP